MPSYVFCSDTRLLNDSTEYGCGDIYQFQFDFDILIEFRGSVCRNVQRNIDVRAVPVENWLNFFMTNLIVMMTLVKQFHYINKGFSSTRYATNRVTAVSTGGIILVHS